MSVLIHPLVHDFVGMSQIVPIIIQMKTDKLDTFVNRISNVQISSGGVLSRFGMVATLATRKDLKIYKDLPYINSIGLNDVHYANEFRSYGALKSIYIGTAESRKYIGADIAQEQGLTGKGIKVSVLDTGIFRLHPQFSPAVEEISALVPEPLGADLFGFKADALKPLTSKGMLGGFDDNGHGCVNPEALVYTDQEGILSIQELYESLDVKPIKSDIGETKVTKFKTLSFSDDGPEYDNVTMIHKIKVNEDIICMKMRGNRTVKLTPWHPTYVLTPEGIKQKRADELTINDYLISPGRTYNDLHNKSEIIYKLRSKSKSIGLDEHLAYLIGACISNGHIPKGKGNYAVSYSHGNKKIIENIRGHAEAIGFKGCKTNLKLNNYRIDIYTGLSRIMNALGIPSGKKSLLVNIPAVISSASPMIIGAFLSGLIDCDGHLDKDRSRIRYVSISRKLIDQMSFLLSMYGITSYITEQEPASHGRIIGRHKVFSLHIAGHDNLIRLLSLINRNSIKLENLSNNTEWISKKETHNGWPYISELNGKNIRCLRNNHATKYTIRKNSKSKYLLKLIEDYNVHGIIEISKEHYDGYFYDFTTEKYHRYLAGTFGGVFISNTHCLSTVGGRKVRAPSGIDVMGVAPDSSLTSIKVLATPLGIGMSSDIIRGIDIALSRGADVISMSLGSKSGDNSTPACLAIKMASIAYPKTVFVIAAGNFGPDSETIGSPGCSVEALTVGSVSMVDGDVSHFSSRGPTADGFMKPDVLAPGGGRMIRPEDGKYEEFIYSGTSPGTVLDISDDAMADGYAGLSGTSMATPHVAGLVAILKQKNRAIDTNYIKSVMESKNIKNNESGWGILHYRDFEGENDG